MDNEWKNFDIEEPSETGLYVVKTDSNNKLFGYGNVASSVMKWDGTDFLLPIGRPITKEVLFWKKI